ncbi:transketolase C-terminal domain-containing protein [Telmatospirillum sp.]|uniref:transketolase family protein n=1 Tax=Telmatospirillum sp. TaxID=2079197 RepID=UPI00283EC0F5|nr:transketolase C-terminal domain-containing protein [Telmatospirillum sp.]MDR3436828.1 transketolase C-terminal domain-containing protein [Telmatospirillum sp.]
MKVQNLREAYGRTLVELGNENPNVVVLEGDLGKSTMSCYFEDAFPKRFFEMGIAEANMTSFAGGLALTGKIPFTNSFAAFAAGRSYDQIRQGICLPNLNVKIVGSSAGLSDYGDGSTHQTVEDIAIMRAIPNLTVLVPADAIETRKMTRAMAAHHGPVYMRVTRTDLPDVSGEDDEFVIGKPYQIRDGKDVVIFAIGAMVAKALDAADLLTAKGLSARVVNVSSLKPVDEAALRELAQGMRGVITAEEHSVIGGLASVITYALRKTGLPVECVGIEDRFGQSAENCEILLKEYGLTSKHIADAALSVAGTSHA